MDQTTKTAEQDKSVIGPDGKEMPARRLTLGIEKFRNPEPHFRLIWINGAEAWFAEENICPYRRKYGPDGVVEAGRKLAARVGAKYFSEVTR
jgi:hypothetical protein